MAWLVDRYGKTFEEAIEILSFRPLEKKVSLGPSDVRIRVAAVALNFFDLLSMVNRYQITYELPFSPCAESAGTVIEVGPQVSRLRPGDQVIVTFGNGALREELVLDERYFVLKPSRLTFAEAAGLFVGYATGYHGLCHRGALKAGETVLVTGAGGGMGTIAVSIAKEMGARVVATVSSEEKRKAVLSLGADECVLLDSDPKQWTKQLKEALGPSGADVCYEVVGGELFQCVGRVMASGGRLLVIGFACGKIGSVAANLPLVKGYSVVGVRSGAELLTNPHLMEDTVRALNRSSLKPLVETFPAHDAKSAFRKLAEKKAIGKLVVTFGEPSPNKSKL